MLYIADLWYIILKYLTFKEIANTCKSSKYLQQLGTNENFWQKYLENKTYHFQKPDNMLWKTYAHSQFLKKSLVFVHTMESTDYEILLNGLKQHLFKFKNLNNTCYVFHVWASDYDDEKKIARKVVGILSKNKKLRKRVTDKWVSNFKKIKIEDNVEKTVFDSRDLRYKSNRFNNLYWDLCGKKPDLMKLCEYHFFILKD